MADVRLIALTRTGFEPECAQELEHELAARGGSGYAQTRRDCGFVVLHVHDAPQRKLRVGELIFVRQLLPVRVSFDALDTKDRVGPILAEAKASGVMLSDVWVETADSPDGEQLRGFARSFESAMATALKREKRFDARSTHRLHLFAHSGTHIDVSIATHAETAPWKGGIPRLRFPSEAPSRSTLKLEEAFLVLLDNEERERWLQAGMTAIDLGACPGGWTYQFTRRSIRTIAVDNGAMAESLMATGIVDHLRADGFRYQPNKAVEWMVCDMVEQPIKVAERMATWLREGWCRRTIFNLKLPMKKRWPEVQRCFAAMRADVPFELDLRAKQLYHDREEITVFATRA
ncbi:MAG: 23S rRNA (cytidine(2498)-2'-O)-methyltransferase RlmM [Rhodanobacteraceae bacterium]|nr:23S rRNA (cytidine(2498)-2'-O)-methyltransferase RlmM [Rhodanobacteraceae bacterium]MBK7044038.1 23S rRNA (cytidine(2498)-2'-O)-methyltransferase RlmM [Rhodanobacteraceae bacterium]HQW80388.1 23S rRNA (cytidine(2498)-2'-O)-methyltransferase RlmM [Pseudomonadota bacterium]